MQYEVYLVRSPKLELVPTLATQAANCEDMSFARSGEAVLHVQKVLAS